MVYGAEAVFNILLNLLLIPRFGYLGASVVTVATELVGAILFYRMFRREFGPGLGGSAMLRMFLAMTLMGVLVYLFRESRSSLSPPAARRFMCFACGLCACSRQMSSICWRRWPRRLKAKILRGNAAQSAR